VGELVAQHDARALAGPAARGRRQNDLRAPSPQVTSSVGMIALEEDDGTAQPEGGADLGGVAHPRSAIEGPRGGGHSTERIRPTRSADSVTSRRRTTGPPANRDAAAATEIAGRSAVAAAGGLMRSTFCVMIPS
jgi:hypothetical protein